MLWYLNLNIYTFILLVELYYRIDIPYLTSIFPLDDFSYALNLFNIKASITGTSLNYS